MKRGIPFISAFLLTAFVIICTSETALTQKSIAFGDGIYELDGRIGPNGTTHLFYRIKDSNPEGRLEATWNLHHYNLETNADSVFIHSDKYIDQEQSEYSNHSYLVDYAFLGSGVGKYIYCYIGEAGYEANGGVKRDDQEYGSGGIGVHPTNLTLSPTDDSTIYLGLHNRTIMSTTAGRTWPITNGGMVEENEAYHWRVVEAIATNESTGELILGNSSGHLVTSHSVNSSPDTVNSAYNWELLHNIVADLDGSHIYFHLIDEDHTSTLVISNNRAAEGSFVASDFSFENRAAIAVNDSISGEIYASANENILKSEDYGKSFNIYKTLDDTVTGLFFDSHAQTLYASTADKILSISAKGTSHHVIKQVELLNFEEENPELPKRLTLGDNYPNPFNPATTIRYSLPQATHVELSLYNVTGRKLATLQRGMKSAGKHSLLVDMSGYAGGVYFYRIETEWQRLSRKMVLIK